MDTKIIEYVIAIAEEKSLSKAAERLYLSQPALSQRLKKLEDELGTPLFVRGKDGPFPSLDAGRIYVNGGHSSADKRESPEKADLYESPDRPKIPYALPRHLIRHRMHPYIS